MKTILLIPLLLQFVCSLLYCLLMHRPGTALESEDGADADSSPTSPPSL